ncbi:RNA-directed DNA polymerase [Micromonospora sp. Llam0]|uniref:group II intron reverse transcriptase/maturase n=1 Tax=Micromonospora sp. Llam0 TaxID=2485143 RepID=UPI000FBE13AE|nr:group II intron reverse transcriptase/maturase [Micromonospora sp. Llam0]ROO60423.1 RNA-directed DNA polymerase [Micromonospora sp. Llam0]
MDTEKVNGPKDPPLTIDGPGWRTVHWPTQEQQVQQLRSRIFKATQQQDWPKVRSLQKLMLRSRANTLVSVRQVAQRNAGRKTAGIDGKIAVTPESRAELAVQVHATIGSWKPLAVKRVHIPKARDKTKLRPLGIPVMADRCHQARVRNALEPEWEARFEPRSYGFRPGRGCHDAIESIFQTLCRKNSTRLWILDSDLAAAFDLIDHHHLMSMIGSFPARDMIGHWLKAGVFEPGKGFAPTVEGTPQGGVISPLLLNIALHGLEEVAGVRYSTARTRAGAAKGDSPVLIRYADDLVVCCQSLQEAQEVKARLATWLTPRGLSFNEEKTTIVHASEGFDFLGMNVRRYTGDKLLIKPSKKAIKRLRGRLAEEMRTLRGSNSAAVMARLNPIIRGWSAYYRTVVSSKTFNALDNYMWHLTYSWARRSHRNRPTRWIVDRHYGRFNKFRNDRWVFGNHDTGAYLLKFSWTPIERHTMVKGGASPDDPTLADYWKKRRRRVKPPLDDYTLRALDRQDGRCALCGEHLLTPEQPPQGPAEWERWWLAVARKAIARDYLVYRGGRSPAGDVRTHLVHTSCHRGHLARERGRAAKLG